MALSLSRQISGPTTVETASDLIQVGTQTYDVDFYVKVLNVKCDKLNCRATVLYRAQSNIGALEKTFEFPLDLEGPNPIKQAYNYLKTLNEFSSAIDC